MKHIIVIAGHRLQFENYVKSFLARNTHVHHYPGDIVVDGITFTYVTNDTSLRGIMLSKNSELVKVGTWYELPQEDIKGIEYQFKARTSVATK